ncbi:MAG: thiamine phosphate synthase [Gemmatimonadales bacterium]
MRPLPRLLAVTDETVIGREDFAVRAAAIAAAGPAVAIVVRAPSWSGARRLAALDRVRRLTTPPDAGLVAHGDPALGRLGRAHGVQVRAGDLAVVDCHRVCPGAWVGVSVHSVADARAARDGGADYLVAGNVFATASHPGRTARGLDWLGDVAAVGLPVVAIGGVTPETAAAVRDAGAWGAAAISALWNAADPARATLELLDGLGER